MNQTENPPANKSKVKRRWLRFGLLDLLLLTALVAAWTPYVLAKRQFGSLENSINSLRQMQELIVVEDDSKIHVLLLRSHRYGARMWEVFVPEGEPYELRFANEQIVNSTFPGEFRRVAISPGRHRIGYFSFNKDDHKHFQVFLDNDLALESRFLKADMPQSSASSTFGGNNLETRAMGESVKLLRMIFSKGLPGYRYQSRFDPTVVSQGAVAWLAPIAKQPLPPTFFVPSGEQYSHYEGWGVREGIRLNMSMTPNSTRIWPGTIQVYHSQTLHPHRFPINQISVRVRAKGQTNYLDSTTHQGLDFKSTGLSITPTNSLKPPGNHWKRNAGALSDDGKTYTLFFHFDRFDNGAAPIIEARFQQEFPNRIGFRVHNAEDATEPAECILSAKACVYPLLRNIQLADETKSLDQLSPKWKNPANKPFEDSNWMLIDGDQFPLVKRKLADGNALRRTLLSTNVDYPEITNFGRNRGGWDYIGLPATHAWLYADSADAQVALRSRAIYRTKTETVPGGPAFSDFEVRMPFDSKQWVYFEIVPADLAIYKADQDVKEAKRKAAEAAKRAKAAEERRQRKADKRKQ